MTTRAASASTRVSSDQQPMTVLPTRTLPTGLAVMMVVQTAMLDGPSTCPPRVSARAC